MPTLSFSCPKCDKQHDRVKPEMVGHKVRCQCGFVFRLGSKSDKQEWVSADLKRKKKLKDQKAHEQAAHRKESSFDLSPRLGAGPMSEDDILDAIPIVATPEQDILSPIPSAKPAHFSEEILDAVPIVDEIPAGLFEDEPLAAIPITQGAAPEPFALDDISQYAADDGLFDDVQPAIPLAPSRQQNYSTPKRNSNSRGKSSVSPGGAIWNLVLSFVGIPVLMLLMIVYGRFAFQSYQTMRIMDRAGMGNFGMPQEMMTGFGGNATAGMIVGLIMFLVLGALIVAMFASAISSIMELSNGNRISWPGKTAAIIASVVIASLFLTFSWQVFNLINQLENIGREMGREFKAGSLLGGIFSLAIKHVMFAVIPIAVAITGFVRASKR